ncbi:hybrid sensor histidine kinase/response regulator transcription factor [Flavivirga jejuensis]|uniref:histidine kinase n=1 Tax=Flavivirga jejuensis TaxID=870487 RepID=A0ABT8WKX4_9FLAO|nr:two-component regulator propeller domain-containing protein [Flavivirga jejuensis]MDO5973807.1 two-component regulator propeller domain-containing protein [Flavivirga jejuensis]
MIKGLKDIKFALFIILLSSGLFSSFFLNAQNFKRFSNKEGFNQNTINAIEQDRYGFLWYGTPNGLIRYDGYEFKTYTTQSKTDGNLSSNFISSLFKDEQGVLWIGTNLGVNVYIPWLERFYTVPLSKKIVVNHIKSGPLGQIWFSGGNHLYSCKLTDIENGVFKVSKNVLKNDSERPSINSFFFKDEKTLILGTLTGLKSISLNDEAQNPYSFDEFKNIPITTISLINNIFWIGTHYGLYKVTFDKKRLHIIESFNDLKKQTVPQKIISIFEDHYGMVWIGTKGDGLYKYNQDQNTFEHYAFDQKNELSISSNLINTLYQDNFNVLWIGTAQGGINKLDLTQKPFINYSNNPYDSSSISDNLITSILEDSRGYLWLSGFNSHLFRSKTTIKNKNIRKLQFEDLDSNLELLNDDIIRCIYEDDKGFIWFGSDNTLTIYNPLNNKFKKVAFQNTESEHFRNIIQIDNKKMLFAGNHIIVVENPWEEIKNSDAPVLQVKSDFNLERGRIQAIVKDHGNSFWIGTNKGLLKAFFQQNKLIIKQQYTTNNIDEVKLSYDNIFSLHKENNHLWIGTFGGGLNKMTLNEEGTPTKIEYFRKNDILPDDAIYGILQEDKSHLWLSTDMGLVKFNINDYNINVFDVRDGLAQNNFRQDCYFNGKSGYFYFGGLNGVTIFKPENIKLNTQPPEILITSLLIDNKPVKINEKISNKTILEKSISETERIAISQNQNIISFNLAVKHTSEPSKNKVAYKLEGFNDNWIEKPTGKTTVTYTNLSAGDYVFRIKAANGDGIWSTTDKKLYLEILPPWYSTWWSYLLFLILIVSICIGVVIYFVQHERLKQGLIYEKMDKERIKTINQGKFRYFTNLSHEFRTPLTLISGPLERIIASNSDTKNVKYLNIIEKNTKRLLSLADQLITFRQAEQGHVNLNLTKCTLGDFIYPTTEAFEDFALEKHINFFYKITEPNEEIILDVEKVERIIFNLLSNSFKNTPAQGNISIEAGISVISDEKIINIDVVDTGKGIPQENLINIFERFYQLGSKDGDISGGGIGLSFCKSLADLLGGEISAKSTPGIETRFSVKIPSKQIGDSLLDNASLTEKSYIKDWVPLSHTVNELNPLSSDTEEQKEYTVLVVENEVDIQNFLMAELSVKYNILIANNGVEAFDKIKLKEPDLIVSDVMMPEMDGYELCEKIKSAPESCHIPVLLLTALGDNDNLIKGLEYGADDYISKPFSLKHLELRINKLIESNVQIKEYFAKNSLLPKGENKNLELSKKDEAFIANIIQVIEKNLSDSSFGVEELSRDSGLSTSHFYRRLKQLTGQVPNVYLRNYRLQRAAELLKSNEGFNVAQVMYQIGIESSSYFSTSFKKLHGVSPSEFLKKPFSNN